MSHRQRSRPDTRLLSVGSLVILVAVLGVVGGFAMTGSDGSTALQQGEESGFSGTANLSDANAELSGVDENDSAGWSVSDAGDVNGDGVDDVLVGAPEADAGGNESGAAYVVYGPVEDDIALDDADVILNGTAAFDRAGESVSNAGDLNGDGIDDLVVGAPGNDTAGPNAGAVYVVYGGASLNETDSFGEANVTLRGGTEGERAGQSVSNASDVNGTDGLVIGAPFADNRTGTAYLVSGDALNGTDEFALGPGNATAVLTGESEGDQAGWSVSNAGNVTDDGTDDVIIGASNWTATGGPTARNQTAGAGAAYVVSANVSGEASLAAANLTLRGVDRFDRAGFSVAAAGDLNNDTVSDVIVGAPFADPDGVSTAGTASVVYGGSGPANRSLADANLTLTGEGAGDRAGWSVSAAGSGDVTCDGVDDVLVGAPGNDTGALDAGAAYVVNGLPGLSGTKSLSETDGKVFGEAAGDNAGQAVSEAGDLDNDTFGDIVVGAPFADQGNATDAGAAYVLINDCVTPTPPTPTPEPTPTPTPTATPTESALDPVETNFECTADGGELTVTNPNDEAVRVVVDGHGRSQQSVTLSPGETRTITGLADGSYDVRTTTTDGQAIGRETLFVSCPTEQVEVTRQCTADGGEVTVQNHNEEPVRVVLEGPGDFQRRVTLAAGGSRTFSDLADGDYAVITRAAIPGNAYRIGREVLSVSCPTEEVEITSECTDDGGALTVTNPNGEPVLVRVDGPGGFEERVRLPGGGERTFSGLADGNYTTTTRAGILGNTYRIGRTTTPVDCEPLEPVVTTTECTADGGNLTVSNPNDETVQVDVGGTVEDRVNLTAGENRTFSNVTQLFGTVAVVTLSTNGTRIGQENVSFRNCASPPPGIDAPEITTRCTADGGELVAENPNDVPIYLDVEGQDRVRIPVNGSQTFAEIPANGNVVLAWLFGPNESAFPRTPERELGEFAFDCPTPDPVDVSRECTGDGGTLTIENPNDETVIVNVTGPDGFEENLTIAGGENRTISGLTNGEYTVDTGTRGTPPDLYRVDRQTVTLDCETVVLEQVETDLTCTADGGNLTVTNPNNETVEVEIDGPGSSQLVTLAPGENRTVTGLADGSYTVRTFPPDAGGDESVVDISQETITVSCPTEPLNFGANCFPDGGDISAGANPNDEAVVVTITGPAFDGPQNTTVTFGPVEFDGLSDGEYTVITRADIEGNRYVIARENFPIDCETPAPTETPTTTTAPPNTTTQPPDDNANGNPPAPGSGAGNAPIEGSVGGIASAGVELLALVSIALVLLLVIGARPE